jgi:hypothetical protein
MRLRQWIALDTRRLFRGRKLIAATVLMPLLGILVFASVVVPLLLNAEDIRVPYAICNEDKSEPVRQFVSLMTNSESLRELAAAYPVEDAETGYELLRTGRVGVLVHIPADFYQTMSAGQDPALRLVAYPVHSFEQTMVRITLEGSLQSVGQSENILQLLGQAAVEAGADEVSVSTLLEAELRGGIEQYMQRRAALGEGGTISPIGERFPLEYYLSAFFSLFAAFAMLPSLYLSAADLNGPVCRRGLLASPAAARRYYLARLLSGAALILLTLLLLLPTGLMVLGTGVYWGKHGGGSVILALAGALPLVSLSYSALSLLLAALCKKPLPALWIGFFLILVMAAISGALVAEGKLPEFLAEAGRFTPMKPAMNLIAGSLFNLEPARYGRDMLRLLLMTSLCAAAGLPLVSRKGGAK